MWSALYPSVASHVSTNNHVGIIRGCSHQFTTRSGRLWAQIPVSLAWFLATEPCARFSCEGPVFYRKKSEMLSKPDAGPLRKNPRIVGISRDTRDAASGISNRLAKIQQDPTSTFLYDPQRSKIFWWLVSPMTILFSPDLNVQPPLRTSTSINLDHYQQHAGQQQW